MSFIEIVDGVSYQDNRGVLSKFISFEDTLKSIRFPVAEVFRSKTVKGFVRGLHFQGGESANNRMIHILDGHIFTYFVDFRTKS
jgi:dTDP-4-dehydrorhamnose 3,5-epimerase-like enzyme